MLRNHDIYCFIWSILASLHPCENDHPNRVSNSEQYFNWLNIDGFDSTNGFKCGHMHWFEKLNNLSTNLFDLNFYPNKDKWKRKLIPIKSRQNESDEVVDLLIYKNHYAPIKKLKVFSADHNKNILCRQCLNSYTN